MSYIRDFEEAGYPCWIDNTDYEAIEKENRKKRGLDKKEKVEDVFVEPIQHQQQGSFFFFWIILGLSFWGISWFVLSKCSMD